MMGQHADSEEEGSCSESCDLSPGPRTRVEKERTHSYKLSSDGVIGKSYVPQTFTN